MIYLVVKSGQMCNQLLSLAAVYSLALEYKSDLVCPITDSFLKEYYDFNYDVNKGICSVKMFYSSFWNLIYCGSKVIRKITKKDFSKQYVPCEHRPQIFFNWLSMLDDVVFCKHVEEIRRFFKIKESIMARCKKNLSESKHFITVGVHIRRGDYLAYENGRYYFDDSTYISWIKHLISTATMPVRFLLCSNEGINIEEYQHSGINAFTVRGSEIEDLCSLSLCDYVMGPPSSYGFWAAMYGNKKRCILDSKNVVYEWEDFKYFEERIYGGDKIR